MSFFTRNQYRSSWVRSYKLPRIQPNDDFMFHQAKQKLTWKELVQWAKNIGKITYKKTEPNDVYYYNTESGKMENITHINGTKLVGQINPDKLGTTLAIPYLHAEFLLYQLYTQHGGKLKRHEITFSKIPDVYDAVY